MIVDELTKSLKSILFEKFVTSLDMITVIEASILVLSKTFLSSKTSILDKELSLKQSIRNERHEKHIIEHDNYSEHIIIEKHFREHDERQIEIYHEQTIIDEHQIETHRRHSVIEEHRTDEHFDEIT
jgi:hypothetical protein